MLPDPASMRYIVFLIDSKIKQHDGKVFCSYKDAKEYIRDTMAEYYADKAVIGMFILDPNAQNSLITMIDTIGFKGDKKDVNQLELFKPTGNPKLNS